MGIGKHTYLVSPTTARLVVGSVTTTSEHLVLYIFFPLHSEKHQLEQTAFKSGSGLCFWLGVDVIDRRSLLLRRHEKEDYPIYLMET